MIRPPRVIGAPPSVGRIWPCSTVGAIDQKPPFATRSASSAVRFLNDAAAIALAREVSVLKKPVPSPRALSTRRPASSTTVTVICAFSARALPCAALSAVSAISSVMSIMIPLLARQGPSPATCCGSLVYKLASHGGAPAPRRAAARWFISSPRTAGPQPRDVLRLALHHWVVVEVLARCDVRHQVMLERAREDLGEALGRPAVGVVHAHDRALVAEQHDLLAADAEDLAGDVAGRVARQEHRDRRDVGGR